MKHNSESNQSHSKHIQHNRMKPIRIKSSPQHQPNPRPWTQSSNASKSHPRQAHTTQCDQSHPSQAHVICFVEGFIVCMLDVIYWVVWLEWFDMIDVIALFAWTGWLGWYGWLCWLLGLVRLPWQCLDGNSGFIGFGCIAFVCFDWIRLIGFDWIGWGWLHFILWDWIRWGWFVLICCFAWVGLGWVYIFGPSQSNWSRLI